MLNKQQSKYVKLAQSLYRILNVVRFHYILIEKSIKYLQIATQSIYYNMATGGKSYRMFTDRLNTITLEENNFYLILSIHSRHIYTLKDSTEFKITYALKYHINKQNYEEIH